MKAWLVYTLARLGIFAAAAVLLLLTPLKWYWAVILAALIGLLISYIALPKLRAEVTSSLANRRGKPEHDVDTDFEDDFVDAADTDVPVERPVSDADRHASRREHDED